MKKSIPSKLISAFCVIALLNLSSCKKYEDGPGFSLRSKKARLVGEWEVESIENNNYFNNYNIEIEFDKDGDMKVTTSNSYDGYSYNYTYRGDWEFSGDKEELEVQIDGSQSTDWEINRLTNKEFWFDDEDGNEWKLEAK